MRARTTPDAAKLYAIMWLFSMRYKSCPCSQVENESPHPGPTLIARDIGPLVETSAALAATRAALTVRR
jgi:hypothetical protein